MLIINNTDKEGDTPLHLAGKFGNKDTIELLLSRGANRDVRTKGGKTVDEIMIEREEGGKPVLCRRVGQLS